MVKYGILHLFGSNEGKPQALFVESVSWQKDWTIWRLFVAA
jgi:hypothetical protein